MDNLATTFSFFTEIEFRFGSFPTFFDTFFQVFMASPMRKFRIVGEYALRVFRNAASPLSYTCASNCHNTSC